MKAFGAFPVLTSRRFLLLLGGACITQSRECLSRQLTLLSLHPSDGTSNTSQTITSEQEVFVPWRHWKEAAGEAWALVRAEQTPLQISEKAQLSNSWQCRLHPPGRWWGRSLRWDRSPLASTGLHRCSGSDGSVSCRPSPRHGAKGLPQASPDLGKLMPVKKSRFCTRGVCA